jgi:hypothetical protein
MQTVKTEMESASALAGLGTWVNRPSAGPSARSTKSVHRIKPADLSSVSKSVMGVAGSMQSVELFDIGCSATVSSKEHFV